MTVFELARANLLSPVVLCFVLGAVAYWARSDLRFPEPVFNALSIFLMLSIGLKGGAELAKGHLSQIAGPALGALAIGCAIPLWTYPLLRRLGGFGVADAAAIAAHYGSVSAVTFAAVQTMLDRTGPPYEGFAAALLAIMEVPAIVVALALTRMAQPDRTTQPDHEGAGMRGAMAEVLAGKSVVLLVGGLVIGALVGPSGLTSVKPFFGDLFQGALCLFLLDLGRVAAGRARDFVRVGPFLAVFAVVMPVLHAGLGIAVAQATGLSLGGAIILAVLAASASYIAAPAAIRLALPEANPGYYLTASLAITFPFNIVVGLPLYAAMARYAYGAG
jgi:hypothetical protein